MNSTDEKYCTKAKWYWICDCIWLHWIMTDNTDTDQQVALMVQWILYNYQLFCLFTFMSLKNNEFLLFH